jgi:glycine cleavage system H protein
MDRNTRFTEEHEWLRVGDDGQITIGITDYAQTQLGDVVYVELPQTGQILTPGDEAAVVESVKAAGEIRTPVGGEVTEVNEQLRTAPELVNRDPMGEGWFFRLNSTGGTELDGLMDEEAYKEFIKGL